MAEQIITKMCIKCNDTKPIDEFRKRKDSKDGHRNDCRICENLRQNKRYHTPDGKKLAMDRIRRYRKTIKGKAISKKAKSKYFNKPENIIKSRRSARERQRSNKKKKSKQNKTKASQSFRDRYPKKYKAHIAVTNAIAQKILPPAKNCKCTICQKKAEQYHHHLGYKPEHWLDVIPVCQCCHMNIHVSEREIRLMSL